MMHRRHSSSRGPTPSRQRLGQRYIFAGLHWPCQVGQAGRHILSGQYLAASEPEQFLHGMFTMLLSDTDPVHPTATINTSTTAITTRKNTTTTTPSPHPTLGVGSHLGLIIHTWKGRPVIQTRNNKAETRVFFFQINLAQAAPTTATPNSDAYLGQKGCWVRVPYCIQRKKQENYKTNLVTALGQIIQSCTKY